MNKIIAFIILCCVTFNAWSAEKIINFPKPGMAQDYKWLTQNLRCQKCANQSLADSESGLASDLRQKVYDLVVSGKNRKEVVSFLSTRFGDRVTYDPPFKRETYFLWLAPVIILLIMIFVMIRAMRSKKPTTENKEPALSNTDQQKLEQLLNSASKSDSNQDPKS